MRPLAAALGLVAFAACEASDVIVPVGGVADSVVITMMSAPVGEQIDAVTDVSIAVGDSVVLEATALSAMGFPLSDVTFAWASVTPGVATVSTAGVVRGIAPGTSHITASTDDVSATVVVTVTDAGEPATAADF